ncbi:hypothetical protein PGT21_025038 [Puccinia graminis f. sp. tritici]|uniref:Uncharacterized protein n=1 Tax=Puccinia graminis f. sp. tritici TaxID=56615 RepID=A0A5B0QLG9_PUCGR|nr:hypothetical protein PGT21_025038 [Puccinia graminis f. sp. tritici]KAA1113784.1 hypothetical protein PGTUg99_020284 [Puccinia graminis f. sp. tritici]
MPPVHMAHAPPNKSTDDSQAKTHKMLVHAQPRKHRIRRRTLPCPPDNKLYNTPQPSQSLLSSGKRKGQGHAIHSNRVRRVRLVLELTPACLELTVCLKNYVCQPR